jgi:hypothetical protein
MPKFICDCGKVLRYSEIPCSFEWLLISDTDFDRFSGTVDAEQVYRATTSLLRCPNCSQVWIFWDGMAQTPQAYVPKELNKETDK